MNIIPVIDVRNGVAVHAVAGRRAEYQPIRSRLTNSTDPIQVAQAMTAALSVTDLYVANLDAIEHRRIDLSLYRNLVRLPVRVWLDAGVSTPNSVVQLYDLGFTRVILGLESMPRLDMLRSCIESAHRESLIFSLDLNGGKPKTEIEEWRDGDPIAIAAEVTQMGIRRLILLDLARVGVGQGTGTETLCRAIRDRHSEVELIVGGGVGSMDDLDRLEQTGADGVLLASALHDGRLNPEDLKRRFAIRRSPTGPALPQSPRGESPA